MTFPEQAIPTKTVGFIINPVAGMGGAVGLKGTDGTAILKEALSLGAKPIACLRADVFLEELTAARKKLKFIVAAGSMGEDEVLKYGFNCQVLGKRKTVTTSNDTQFFAKEMVNAHVDLLVFCGGDGTTRDIQKSVGLEIPVLGVPTGVKMHSSVFAVSPKAAARAALRYLWAGLPLREAEVMDVDEQAFREGHLSAQLFGYVLTPYEPELIQANKMASPMTENELRNQAAIAIYVIENMQPNIIYVVGPGTTTRTIGDLLDAKKSLLGVDVFVNKKIVEHDVNEKRLLQVTKGKAAVIIVTPIGGQGFIFGRGNQQISAKVIRQIGTENIIVVATKSKLHYLQSLRVDTGDPSVDAAFKERKQKVILDYGEIEEKEID